MTTRKKPETKMDVQKPSAGKVKAVFESGKDQAAERAKAELFVSPASMGSAASVKFLQSCYGETDVEALYHTLRASMERVNKGDLGEVESMLMGQAHALQAMFASLSRRAVLNMGEYTQAADTYMRLALRAQSQCRATLETLAAIKNPPVVLARQANVTTGPQQINNGVTSIAPACEEPKPVQKELLEGKSDAKWVDTRTKKKAS